MKKPSTKTKQTDETNNEADETETHVEVIEVEVGSGDESGEEVTEEVVTTTIKAKTTKPVESIESKVEEKMEEKKVVKQATIEKQASITEPETATIEVTEEHKVVIKQATIEKQASADTQKVEQSDEKSSVANEGEQAAPAKKQASVEEEEEEEEEEVEEEEVEEEMTTTTTTTETKAGQHESSVSNETKAEKSSETVTVETKQQEVTDSLAQLKLTESAGNEKATAPGDDSSEVPRRASIIAAPIPKTVPIQQTAPMQQAALVQQAPYDGSAPPPMATPAPPKRIMYGSPQPQSHPQSHYIQPNTFSQPPKPTHQTYYVPTAAPVSYATQPPPPANTYAQIPQENIRNQLQEIVSDIDRAVEEQKIFNYVPPQNIQSTISQNNSTEVFKKSTTSSILQKPSYFYQVRER